MLSAYGALASVDSAFSVVREQWNWHPASYQNMTWVALTAFGATGDYDRTALLERFEGWVGLDQIHEGNEHFRSVLDRFERRYGRRPFHCYTALGFDHGFVVADGWPMKPPYRDGFKEALERLRMQPSWWVVPEPSSPLDHTTIGATRVTTSCCALLKRALNS